MNRLTLWRLSVATCAAMVSSAWAALPIQHWTQPEGTRVYLVETRNLPMLDVQVDIDAGSRRDPAAQAGLASATAHLLTLGAAASGGRPALDENALVEAWADLGAQFSASVNADRMSLRLRTLSRPDVLNGAVQLAAQQLAAPTFPAKVWQRDRERLIGTWKEAQTQPGVHAHRLFEQAVFGSHPYGFEAKPATWAAIDVAKMREFYQRHARRCDASVTLVGAVDRAEADRIVQRLLQGWGTACPSLPQVPEVPPLVQAQRIDQPFAAAQAQVLVGQPGIARSDPGYFPLTVGNYILGGGGFVSRLMREIREKRGLTYGVYSQFDPGRHAGAFTISMQTKPDQAREAIELIHSELQRFVSEGPTEQELSEAKASLVNGFALRIDSNRKLLENVANLAWNGLPLDYLDTWTQQVNAVTREQVRQAFQRVLQADRMVTVTVGARQP